MAFTPEEQTKIKYFLKYPDWQSMSNGVQLGIPAGAQAMYLVEQSFQRLTSFGEDQVREVLEECTQVECQIKVARKRIRAAKLGDLETNPNELRQLKIELEEWRQRLSDTLGAPINPYTLQNPSSGAGGINARVIG